MTETQIAVGVFGAAGRMGAEVCRAVEAAAGPGAGGGRLDVGRRPYAGRGGAEVMVDFTHPDAVMDNLSLVHRARHPRRGRHHRLHRRTGSTQLR